MAKTMKDATQAGQKWARNLQGATQQITAGVQRVQTSPGQAAAAQRQLWLANVTASADRWANAVQGVSLQYWQQSMLGKGLQHIAQGVTQGLPRMTAFLQQWLQYEQQVVGSLPARGDFATNKQRATMMMDANHEAKGRFRQRGKSAQG